MRHRPKRGKRVLLCPKCNSPEIVLVAGMIMGQVYHCPKCDYVGSLVFEQELADDGTPRADPE
jgi:transposase-like protein